MDNVSPTPLTLRSVPLSGLYDGLRLRSVASFCFGIVGKGFFDFDFRVSHRAKETRVPLFSTVNNLSCLPATVSKGRQDCPG